VFLGFDIARANKPLILIPETSRERSNVHPRAVFDLDTASTNLARRAEQKPAEHLMRALAWYGKEDIRCVTVTDPEIEDSASPSCKLPAARSAVRISTCSTISFRRCFRATSWARNDGRGRRGRPRGRRLAQGRRPPHLALHHIICSECEQCRRGNFSICEGTNRKKHLADRVFGHTTAGLFGYTHLTGGYPGGQAEYMRVPFADATHIKVPDEPTDTVAVWGCGPVGQMAPQRRRQKVRGWC
jgi:Alcohol dehydrogenase GroES-like domain